VTSPEVRLSPNARNFVRDNLTAGADTVTVNVHDREVAAASVAVHCTEVTPRGKADPDWRLQLTCTGETPPVVVGAANVTDTAPPENAVVVTFAGHVIASAGPAGIVVVVVVGGTVVVVVVVVAGGGLGELGDEQAALSITPARSAVR
jgi:hypothetical protein